MGYSIPTADLMKKGLRRRPRPRPRATQFQQEPSPPFAPCSGTSCSVCVHPCPDGNGHIGRLLMNVMLAAGGYPWTVIPVERRDDYMAALEDASVRGEIGPFTGFLAGLVRLA